jgi:hypothetical protein
LLGSITAPSAIQHLPELTARTITVAARNDFTVTALHASEGAQATRTSG